MPDEFSTLLVRKEQIKDWLREAERDRLACLALAGQQRRERWVRRLLRFLGDRMVVWGRCLLERYGSPIEAPQRVGWSTGGRREG